MTAPHLLLVSAVTAEFGPYRAVLRRRLAAPALAVHVQEDFVASAGALLNKLDAYVRSSSYVVHLVGQQCGELAPPDDVSALLSRYPDLTERVPCVRDAVELARGVSYTQWEAYLAVYHHRPLLVCVAGSALNAPSPAQQSHLQRLLSLGRHVQLSFSSVENLVAQLLAVDDLQRLRLPGTSVRVGRVLRSHNASASADASTTNHTLALRREAIAGGLHWRQLCLGHYYPRADLTARCAAALREFCSTPAAGTTSLPVFWLEGRAGDGKSVLLLQAVRECMRIAPARLWLRIEAPHELAPAIVELRHEAERAVIVFDDMQRLQDEPEALRNLADLLHDGLSLVRVVTSGPTPELDDFRAATNQLCSFTRFRVPGPTRSEVSGLAAWLARPEPVWVEGQRLVESLLDLDPELPLSAFARSFRARLARLDPELVAPATSLMAASVVGASVDVALFATEPARGLMRRLSEPDERCWALDACAPTGGHTIRAPHARLALALFDAWTASPLLRVPLPVRFAEALCPVVRLYRGRSTLLHALLDAILSRGPTQAGVRQGAWVSGVLDGLLERLGDELELLCEVLLYVMRWLEPRVHHRPPAALVRTALRLSASEPLNARARCELAMQLLALSVRGRLQPLPRVRKLVERLIAELGTDPCVGAGLAVLARQPEAIANGWDRWALDFLTAAGASTPCAALWIAWLARDDAPKEHVNLALLQCASTEDASFLWPVLGALARQAGRRRDVYTAVVRWVRPRLSDARSGPVLVALLDATARDSYVQRLAAAFLDEQRGADEAWSVLAALVLCAKHEPAVRARALAWIEGAADQARSALLLCSLLDVQQPAAELVQRALACAETSAASAAAARLWVRLLRLPSASQDLDRRARDWLALHWRQAAGFPVLLALIQRGDCSELALRWLSSHSEDDSSPDIWGCLLARAGQRDDVVKAALAWLQSRPPSPAMRKVLSALIANAGARADVVEYALARLRSPAAHLERCHQVLAALVSVAGGAGGRAEVRALALDWLDAHGDGRGAVHVLCALMSAAAWDDSILSRARRWFDEHRHIATSHEVLAALLRYAGQDTELRAEAQALVDATKREEGSLARALLHARAAHDPFSEALPRDLTSYIRSRASVGQRAGVLSQWLRACNTDARAVAWVVRSYRNGAGRAATAQSAVLARACADQVEVVLAAAHAYPQLARELCFLVACGSSASAVGARRLLDAHRAWPRRQRATFWRTVLLSRELPSECYRDRLADYLHAHPRPGPALLRAIASHPELSEWVRPQLSAEVGRSLERLASVAQGPSAPAPYPVSAAGPTDAEHT